MKLLFSFYMPSGGMGTLNRIRSEAFNRLGHDCRLLYTATGKDTSSVEFLQEYLGREQFQAITASSDYTFLQKIRQSGYKGLLIYEVQGYGPPEEGQKVILQAAAYIREFADAVVYPRTTHLANLFETHVPDVPQFSFDNPLDSRTMRHRKFPPRKGPVIGWVGRIEYNKNWAELLELTHRLIAVYPDLYIWMFGDTALDNQWELEQFRLAVRSYDLEERIIRHSNVPYALMADYFSIIGDSGGFLCSTSILEGFGYAVSEAMLCRCPVLSSASDGVSRFIDHRRTGMLYQSGNVDDAYQAALLLMNNPTLRQQVRRSGMLHIRNHFRPESYVAHFEEMLRDLMVRKYGLV